jgi:hypothetical protein
MSLQDHLTIAEVWKNLKPVDYKPKTDEERKDHKVQQTTDRTLRTYKNVAALTLGMVAITGLLYGGISLANEAGDVKTAQAAEAFYAGLPTTGPELTPTPPEPKTKKLEPKKLPPILDTGYFPDIDEMRRLHSARNTAKQEQNFGITSIAEHQPKQLERYYIGFGENRLRLMQLEGEVAAPEIVVVVPDLELTFSIQPRLNDGKSVINPLNGAYDGIYPISGDNGDILFNLHSQNQEIPSDPNDPTKPKNEQQLAQAKAHHPNGEPYYSTKEKEWLVPFNGEAVRKKFQGTVKPTLSTEQLTTKMEKANGAYFYTNQEKTGAKEDGTIKSFHLTEDLTTIYYADTYKLKGLIELQEYFKLNDLDPQTKAEIIKKANELKQDNKHNDFNDYIKSLPGNRPPADLLPPAGWNVLYATYCETPTTDDKPALLPHKREKDVSTNLGIMVLNFNVEE